MNSLSSSLIKNQRIYAIVGIILMTISTIISPLSTLSVSAESESTDSLKKKLEDNGIKEDTKVHIVLSNDETKEVSGQELYEIVSGQKEHSEEDIVLKVKDFSVLESIKENEMTANGTINKKNGKKYVFLDYDLEEHYDKSIDKYRTCPPLRITSSVISVSSYRGQQGPPSMGVYPDLGDFKESVGGIGTPGRLVTPQGNIIYDNYYGKEEMDITVKVKTHEKHNVPDDTDGLRRVRDLDLYVFGVTEDGKTKEIVKLDKTSENNQEIIYNVTLDKETLKSIERNELLIDYRGVRDRSYESYDFLYGIHMDLFVNKYDIDNEEKESYIVSEEQDSCVQVTKSSGGVDNAFGSPGAPGPIYVDYNPLEFKKYTVNPEIGMKAEFELEYVKGKNVMDKVELVEFYAESNELLNKILKENNSSTSAKKAFIIMSERNIALEIKNNHPEKYLELNNKFKSLCGEGCAIDYPYSRDNEKEEMRVRVIFEGLVELIEEGKMDGYENISKLLNFKNDGYSLHNNFFYSIKSFKEKGSNEHQAFFIKKDNEEKHYTDEDKYSIVRLENGEKYTFAETKTKIYSTKQQKWMEDLYEGHTSRNYEEIAVVNIPKVNFNVEKVWKNNKGETIKPGTEEITVEIFNDEDKVSEVVLSEKDNWESKVELPMYFLQKENSSLKEIKDYINDSKETNYTFKEKEVDGFTSTVTNENGRIVVTNTKNVCTDFKVISEDENSNVVITDENGEIFAEGEIKEGEFSSGKPLVNGKKYKVEISKNGYISKSYEVIGEDYSCEFAADKLIEYTCSDFTVKSKDEGAKVVITDEKGNLFAEGLVNGGKFNSSKPLTPGGKYSIEISKEGFKKETYDVTGSKDECIFEATALKENVCTDFTVNINEENADVKIIDKDGNLFAEGISKNGKFISTKPLTPGEEYTLKVSKDGFETLNVSLKGEKMNCEVTVELKVKPTPPIVNPNLCEDFTVVLKGENSENAKVTVKDSEGNIFFEGTTNKEGKVNSGKPLAVNKKYTVAVEKEGYKTVSKEVIGNEEVCETEVSIEKEEKPTPPVKPEVCENFTVKTNSENAKVTVKDSEGNIFFEGITNKEGNIQTQKPLSVNKKYTVTVEKDGYKTVTKEIVGNEEVCETEVSIEKEEEPTPPVKPEVCENFTVKVKGDNSEDVKVTIKDSEGNIFFEEKTNSQGQIQTTSPLEANKKYTVIIEKEGYKTVSKEVTGSEEVCKTEISIEKEEEPTPPIKPETCENFTIKVGKNGENAKVVIKDKDGNIHSEGVIKDGKFTGKPLEEGKEYTITVSKSGYYTSTSKVTGNNDSCETEVEMKRRPSGGGSSKPEPETCENFTVNTNSELNGAKVVIKDKNGIVEEGYISNGKFEGRPLEKDVKYTVEVSKDGYVTKTISVYGDNDKCYIDVSLEKESEKEPEEKPTPEPEYCESITVIYENGEKVISYDKNGKVIEEVEFKNGKAVITKTEEVSKVVIIKEGEVVQEVTEFEDCVIVVNEKPDNKPEKPEEKPSKPEEEFPVEITEDGKDKPTNGKDKPSVVKPSENKPSANKDKEVNKGKLPQTNTEQNKLVYPLGAAALILSLLIFPKRRRKQ